MWLDGGKSWKQQPNMYSSEQGETRLTHKLGQGHTGHPQQTGLNAESETARKVETLLRSKLGFVPPENMSSKTFTSPENIKWNPVELRLDFFDWLGLDVAQGVVQDLVVKGRLHGFHLKRFLRFVRLKFQLETIANTNTATPLMADIEILGGFLGLRPS